MKRIFVLFLTLLLLVPVTPVAATAYSDQGQYECSNWAREGVKKALDLGIPGKSYGGGLGGFPRIHQTW